MLPVSAFDRNRARPAGISPTTVTLTRISFRRVESPPARTHRNLREARRSPARNRSSQRPVCVSGRARLSRKQRGVPPIAATSLTARARHFQPTASGGCFSRKKWVPSRNQSQVRIVYCSPFGRKSDASSPIPRATDCPAFQDAERKRSAIFLRIKSSFWRFRGMRFRGDSNLPSQDSIACAASAVSCASDRGTDVGAPQCPTCTLGQGTGSHRLTLFSTKNRVDANFYRN